MSDVVSCMLSVEIKGGPPKLSAPYNATVEAYERIQVIVPGGDGAGTPVTLNLMPAGSTPKIFGIVSSRYGQGLTYKGDGNAIPLDGPQLFTAGSAQLLGKLETLTVTNAMGAGQDATLTILVGRDVSPPPPAKSAETKTPTNTDTKPQTNTDTAATDANAQAGDSGAKKKT